MVAAFAVKFAVEADLARLSERLQELQERSVGSNVGGMHGGRRIEQA